jgi:hypothetical protein
LLKAKKDVAEAITQTATLNTEGVPLNISWPQCVEPERGAE